MDAEAAKGCHQRNIRDSLKGSGPCDIRHEVKLRSGKPNYWCFRHGMEAAAPDGTALESCEASWFDAVPEELRASFDINMGELAVWGDFRAPLRFGNVPELDGKVHVHLRSSGTAEKEVDRSYDIVTVRNGSREVTIEGMAAVAYSTSVLAEEPTKILACKQCGELHIDEALFATRPHKKHLCNSCGRNFNDTNGPSVANPLADLSSQLGLEVKTRSPVSANRSIAFELDDFSGVAMWPSNQAILSTMSRAEEHGIHIHAWDLAGKLVVDETYSEVVCSGNVIERADLVLLTLQRAAAPAAQILALDCSKCSRPLSDVPADDWITPRTSHTCADCGAETRTRRKVLLNPLGASAAT